MRCAIYARVSTKRDEQRNCLENQIAFTSEISISNGWIVAEKYIDNGVSGTTFEKRDEIQRLMRDAKAKKFDVIIAKSVSRFGRETLEYLKAVAELEKIGLRLVFPEDYYDSEKNKNKMTFQLKAILAEDESARMSARIKIGIQVGGRKGNIKPPLLHSAIRRMWMESLSLMQSTVLLYVKCSSCIYTKVGDGSVLRII